METLSESGSAGKAAPPARWRWARHYVGALGLALVNIPPGSKATIHKGWNVPGGYFDESGL